MTVEGVKEKMSRKGTCLVGQLPFFVFFFPIFLLFFGIFFLFEYHRFHLLRCSATYSAFLHKNVDDF